MVSLCLIFHQRWAQPSVCTAAIKTLFMIFPWLTKSSEVPSLSSSMDWMREMWTPISLWMPEHSMQVRMPKLVESHLGSTNTKHKIKIVNGVCKFLEPINLPWQLDSWALYQMVKSPDLYQICGINSKDSGNILFFVQWWVKNTLSIDTTGTGWTKRPGLVKQQDDHKSHFWLDWLLNCTF